MTTDASECIDHIAITARLVGNSPIHIEEWNINKKPSDHKGIMAELCENEAIYQTVTNVIGIYPRINGKKKNFQNLMLL